jgi:hypothetical protein
VYSIIITGLFAGLFTQSIWRKEFYLKWFFICGLNLLLVYFFTKNEFGLNGLIFGLFPFCWLILSLLFKALFKLFLIIFKGQFKTRNQNFITHVIFGDFNLLYDKKLQKPTLIDFCFSYGHLVALILLLGKLYKLYFRMA